MNSSGKIVFQREAAFQSDYIKEALEESGELGKQVDDGIWEPGVKIDKVQGRIKLPSTILANIFKYIGIKTPVVDLDKLKRMEKFTIAVLQQLVKEEVESQLTTTPAP